MKTRMTNEYPDEYGDYKVKDAKGEPLRQAPDKTVAKKEPEPEPEPEPTAKPKPTVVVTEPISEEEIIEPNG